MRRCLAAAVLSLAALLTAPAEAQFRATAPAAPVDFPESLICGILQQSPPDKDDDPVHMIVVKPGFKDAGGRQVLSDLSVLHVTAFGRKFSRSEQYSNDRLDQAQGKLEIVWSGTWRKNPAVKMVGRMWHAADRGRWYYVETQFRDGREQMQTTAGCHPSEPPEL